MRVYIFIFRNSLYVNYSIINIYHNKHILCDCKLNLCRFSFCDTIIY
nr:MAG TPA: hypothetical protein [Bacteriophage sp.]